MFFVVSSHCEKDIFFAPNENVFPPLPQSGGKIRKNGWTYFIHFFLLQPSHEFLISFVVSLSKRRITTTYNSINFRSSRR